MKQPHKKTIKSFLQENSFYQDTQEKGDFLSNVNNIADGFVFSFLGILGVLNGAENKTRVIQYFKSDGKLRLDRINDTNNNMSLIVKLMDDKGAFKKLTTVSMMTRFLVKLKQGQLDQVDDSIIRGYIKDGIKPLWLEKNVSDSRLKTAVKQFIEDDTETLHRLAVKLRKIRAAVDPTISSEFMSLAKASKLKGIPSIDNAPLLAAPVTAPVAPLTAPVAPVTAPVAPVTAPVAPVAPVTAPVAPVTAPVAIEIAGVPDIKEYIILASNVEKAKTLSMIKDEEKRVFAEVIAYLTSPNLQIFPSSAFNEEFPGSGRETYDRVTKSAWYEKNKDKVIYLLKQAIETMSYGDYREVLQKFEDSESRRFRKFDGYKHLLVSLRKEDFLKFYSESAGHSEIQNDFEMAIDPVFENLEGLYLAALDRISHFSRSSSSDVHEALSYLVRFIGSTNYEFNTKHSIDVREKGTVILFELLAKAFSFETLAAVATLKYLNTQRPRAHFDAESSVATDSIRDSLTQIKATLDVERDTILKGKALENIIHTTTYSGLFGSSTYVENIINEFFLKDTLELDISHVSNMVNRTGVYAPLPESITPKNHQEIFDLFAKNVQGDRDKVALISHYGLPKTVVLDESTPVKDLIELFDSYFSRPELVPDTLNVQSFKALTFSSVFYSVRVGSMGSERKTEAALELLLYADKEGIETRNSIYPDSLVSSGILGFAAKETQYEMMKRIVNNPTGIIGNLFSKESIKQVSNREAKNKVKDFFFGMFFDVVERDPHLADQFYANLDPYFQEQIRAKMLSANIIIDFIQEGPVLPFDKIDDKRLKQILEFNNVDLNQIFKDVKPPRKKKGQTISQYLQSARGISTDLKSRFGHLKVEEVEVSEEDLNAKTVEIVKNTFAGKHGKIYPRFRKVFKVSLPTDAWEEFAAQMEAAGIDNQHIFPAFHGTGGIAASMILRFGFALVPATDPSVVGNMIGSGAYFAINIDKALQYVGNSGYGRQYGSKGYIFEMDTQLGKRGENYEAAGLGGDNIRSPEWVVRNPQAQTKVLIAYETELVTEGTYKRIEKESQNKNENVFYSFKTFFLNESNMNRAQHQEQFTFWDGEIPLVSGNKYYSKVTERDLPPNARIEETPVGPAVVFTGTKTTANHDIKYGNAIPREIRDHYYSLLNGSV